MMHRARGVLVAYIRATKDMYKGAKIWVRMVEGDLETSQLRWGYIRDKLLVHFIHGRTRFIGVWFGGCFDGSVNRLGILLVKPLDQMANILLFTDHNTT